MNFFLNWTKKSEDEKYVVLTLILAVIGFFAGWIWYSNFLGKTFPKKSWLKKSKIE